MFAYCINTPTILRDSAGHDAEVVVGETEYIVYVNAIMVKVIVTVSVPVEYIDRVSVAFSRDNGVGISFTLDEEDFTMFFQTLFCYAADQEQDFDEGQVKVTPGARSNSWSISSNLMSTLSFTKEIYRDDVFIVSLSAEASNYTPIKKFFDALANATSGLSGGVPTGCGSTATLGSAGGVYAPIAGGPMAFTKTVFSFI